MELKALGALARQQLFQTNLGPSRTCGRSYGPFALLALQCTELKYYHVRLLSFSSRVYRFQLRGFFVVRNTG